MPPPEPNEHRKAPRGPWSARWASLVSNPAAGRMPGPVPLTVVPLFYVPDPSAWPLVLVEPNILRTLALRDESSRSPRSLHSHWEHP